MKRNLTVIVGIMMMLVSSAFACHYYCSPTGTDPSTITNPTLATPGQVLKFAGQDSGATYNWAAHDENGFGIIAPSASNSGQTIGTAQWSWTVPNNDEPCGQVRYYTVTWVANKDTVNSQSCSIKGCIYIKVTYPCITCPTFPDFCENSLTAPTYTPTLIPPASWASGYTYTWTYDSLAQVSGNPATLSTTGLNGLAPGTYPVTLVVKHGTDVIQTCNANSVVVKGPTGGVTVSNT